MATPAEKICLIQVLDHNPTDITSTSRGCTNFRIKLLKFLISKAITYTTFGLILFYCLRQPMEHYIKNKLINSSKYYLEPDQINNTASYLCETFLEKIWPAWPTPACIGAIKRFLPGLGDKIPDFVNALSLTTVVLIISMALYAVYILGSAVDNITSACVNAIPDRFFGYHYAITATPATTARTDTSLPLADRDIHTGVESCERRFSVRSGLIPAK